MLFTRSERLALSIVTTVVLHCMAVASHLNLNLMPLNTFVHHISECLQSQHFAHVHLYIVLYEVYVCAYICAYMCMYTYIYVMCYVLICAVRTYVHTYSVCSMYSMYVQYVQKYIHTVHLSKKLAYNGRSFNYVRV